MALILYRIYQVLIMLPLAFVATLLASLITIAGCLLGGSRIFSYYPAHIWAKICCWLSLVKVTVNGREKHRQEHKLVSLSPTTRVHMTYSQSMVSLTIISGG